MKQLNTMESYVNEGFKIIRDEQVVTLTSKEMASFRFMEQALNGRSNIEAILEDNDDYDQDIVKQMKDDIDLCHDLQEEIIDAMYDGSEDDEVNIIIEYYNWYVNEGQF